MTRDHSRRGRFAAILGLAFVAGGVSAQAPSPSWGTTNPPQQAGALAAQPQPSAAAARAQALPGRAGMTPPTPRDCKKLITKADPSYHLDFGRSMTNGYTSPPDVDLGYVLNVTRGVGNSLQGNHDDLQVRIEQLRCENENIQAKLDYIIRRLP
jgi:hypothetical protein